MPGLDPGIHQTRKGLFKIDGLGIEPGNDEEEIRDER
jgi:hypothetical protein